ncbi:hypothetical protein ACQKML_13700 [Peribacillus frigoritolerans]
MYNEPDTFFGIRFIVIIFIWGALGISFMNIDNHQGVFSSMVLYLIPLALDYYGHMPIEKKNKKRKSVGFWSSLIIAAIFMIGASFSGSLNISFIVTNIWFLLPLWILSGFYVYLAGIDWVTYSSDEEIHHRQEIQKIHRKKMRDEPMDKRVSYYKKKKKRESKPQTETAFNDPSSIN